jgi:hypothetical protein
MNPVAQKFVLNAVLLKTRIIENASRNAAKSLKLGATYEYSIELGISFAFWPLEISVQTSVKDIMQLGFVGAETYGERIKSWEFEALLHPNQPGGEYTRSIECDKAKHRTKENLTIEVSCDGSRERLNLGVKIG